MGTEILQVYRGTEVLEVYRRRTGNKSSTGLYGSGRSTGYIGTRVELQEMYRGTCIAHRCRST
jgi:hypothetical protein